MSMQDQIIYKDARSVYACHNRDGVQWLSSRKLDTFPGIRHAIATRHGGVSTGMYTSLNFSVSQGDDPENVRQNFIRFGDAIGIPASEMVLTQQTHTTNLRYCTEQDRGKGVLCERDYHDVDGLYTDREHVALVISFADCVPVFLTDPVHRVIAAVHSGWRGTVGRISTEMVGLMAERFGTDPADITALIGPSICAGCYEVDEPVVERFREVYSERDCDMIFYQTEAQQGSGHYQLDLWQANRLNLEAAGVTSEHIEMTNLCTCCNPQLIFSHRATGGRRGVTVGVIEMV